VPGLFRFVYYYAGENQQPGLTESEAIKLSGKSAIQYGTIVSRIPTSYFFSPYLALNRDTFKISMDQIDHEKIVNREPVQGVSEITWEIPATDSIIVDDLDESFAVVEDESDAKGLRRLEMLSRSDAETDQGLPIVYYNILPRGLPLPDKWSRMNNTNSWGQYRHTTAVIKPDEGSKKVKFSANLPNDGAWDLETYLPGEGVFPGRKWGTWHIVVSDSNGDENKIEFDSDAGIEGWNMVEKLDLPKGKVTVEVSDKTDGDFVIADAIRWTPSAGN
jgi:hypothetical protein